MTNIHQTTFLKMAADECKAFLDNTAGPDTPVCGQPARPGSSYCQDHHGLIWVKPTRLRLGSIETAASRAAPSKNMRIL